MRRRTYFKAYHAESEQAGMTELSSQFFSMADHLNGMAREKRAYPGFNFRSFGYASVIFYVSAVEAYLNEQLTLSIFLAKENLLPGIVDLTAKIKEMTIGLEKIKNLCTLYTRNQNIDLAFANEMLALISARNEIIHYTPTFNHTVNLWPQRLEVALRDSGTLPIQWALWTVVEPLFLDWARETTKSFLIKYNKIVGGVDPFDISVPDHMRWNEKLQSTSL
jgi:hypothetical protein